MLKIQGARTQHLWDDNATALFVNMPIDYEGACKILKNAKPKVIELLWPGDKGWNSLLRSELNDCN
jgi:hypothetical protein